MRRKENFIDKNIRKLYPLIMKFRKECIYRYSKYLHSRITNNTLTKQK